MIVKELDPRTLIGTVHHSHESQQEFIIFRYNKEKGLYSTYYPVLNKDRDKNIFYVDPMVAFERFRKGLWIKNEELSVEYSST